MSSPIWGHTSFRNQVRPLPSVVPVRVADQTIAGREDSITYSRGPEYFTVVRPANTEGSSTRSRSSRSTINQVSTVLQCSVPDAKSRFRLSVIARDSVCLITDEHYDACEAAHIIPQSRPDVSASFIRSPPPISILPAHPATDAITTLIRINQLYHNMLGIPDSIPPPLFEPEFGLLLRKDLHHSFDRLDFSFYPVVSSSFILVQ
jgi:hypothetical protein